jgi:predicted AAA+ superfamily ATPase
MKKRTLSNKIVALAKKFPSIYIGGPRQSGKTTLTRALFPNHRYVSLEDPDQREFAVDDPRGFMDRFGGGVVMDEVQRAPALFSYIQGYIDRDRTPGRYILTGSQQFLMMKSISQSLAGRIAVVQLLPFSLGEMLEREAFQADRIDRESYAGEAPAFTLDWILRQGLYPAIHDLNIDVADWMPSYYRTYVERDVRDLTSIGDLEVFNRFIRLCAGRSGQVLNLSSLGADAGISHTSARRWISVLAASGLVFLLQPHHVSFSKRLVKSPKLYFIDTGLLCYLLRIARDEDVYSHPLRGPIFETFVFSEFFKSFAHTGREPPLFFWRDRSGNEIDLLIDLGVRSIPVEIKSGGTVSGDFFSTLNYWLEMPGNEQKNGVLVYGGKESYTRGSCLVRPWYACS